jgi:tRNA (mo5U34)-methyltransferase
LRDQHSLTLHNTEEMVGGGTFPTVMSYTKEELKQMAQSVPFWWHSIELGQGVVTNGFKTAEALKRDLNALHLPELRGRTVLDIGAYDGFFSFEAERRGAERVVALDHYVWALDLPKTIAYWRECNDRGVPADPKNEASRFYPEELPGMLAYNTAHRALGSKVETVVQDFMEADPDQLGTFDIVLFLGVLYHTQNPLEALKRVAALTRDMAVIETEAIALPGNEHRALCEFFEGAELNNDPSNWWAPNEKAVAGMCRAAGFSRVKVVVGSPLLSYSRGSATRKIRSSVGRVLRKLKLREKLPDPIRYRAIVYAWK